MSGLRCIRDISFAHVKNFLNGDKRPEADVQAASFTRPRLGLIYYRVRFTLTISALVFVAERTSNS